MVVGAAAHQAHAAGGEGFGEGLGVLHHLHRILPELRPQGFGEGDSLAGDDVHQWPPLLPREDGAVEHLGVGRAAHGDAAARATERLVGGARDEVGNRDGVVVDPGGDEPGVVGHVDHQLGADLPRDLSKGAVGDLAGIGAGTGDDELRLVLAGEPRHLIEVEALIALPHAVMDKLVEHPGGIELHAVRQVAAMGEVEGEDRVARLDRGHVDRGIGLGAGVGLDIDMLGAEQALEPVAGEVLDLVDELTAAVVAVAGIALGVFVREHAPDRLHDGGAGEVFTGDHLQPLVLARLLGLHGGPDVRVFLFDEVHGGPP